MTLEQVLEEARASMLQIYAEKLEHVIAQMKAHGVRCGDIAVFEAEQRTQFELWMAVRLAEMHDGLLEADGWQKRTRDAGQRCFLL